MNILKTFAFASFLFSPMLWAQQATSLPCKGENPSDSRPRIGLVLGGGGARGIAHVSIIKELERLGVPIDCIAGTSMGSMVGGMYASGMTSGELETMFRTMDWPTVLKDDVPRDERSFRRKQDDLESLAPIKPGVGKGGLKVSSGLIAGENIQLFLERQIGKSAGISDFNKLPIPYRAVATNINTGKAEVLSSGSLALAMRASMSIPGAFNPVTINGNILVDGGLVNQLPIDVVRAMGADIVIAVDVGTPLQTIDSTSSALAIGDQIMSFLTVGNTDEQLKTLSGNDVLIQPNLGNEVTTAAFEKYELALQIGNQAARQASPKLALLANPANASPPQIAVSNKINTVGFVELVNDTKYDDRVFTVQLQGLVGKPLNYDAIEDRMHAIYGQYPLELVTYRVLEQDGKTGLIVKVTPPAVGTKFGEFGLNFSGNAEGQFLFNFTTGILIAPLNASGGELRTLLTLGDEPRLTSEWYQPFAPASQYFTLLKAGYRDPIITIANSDGDILAGYDNPNVFISAKLGKSYGNWGEFGLAVVLANGELNRSIGSTSFPEYPYKQREWLFGFKVDTLDSLYLPRSGLLIDFNHATSVDAWGSDDDYKQVNLDVIYARALGKHSGFGGLRWHETYEGTAGFQNWYSLGGVTRFAAYQAEQLHSENYALAYIGYTYELGKVLGRSAVLGGTVEYGKLWSEALGFNISNYQTHGSVYFGFDSWLGTLMVGYGRSTEGDSNLFIELGRTR